MKRLYFITNLQSGKNAIRGKLAAVIDRFTAAGYEVTVRTTQERMDACAAAEYACLSNRFDLIVCSGGDGTLNETVQGLMHSGRPLPLGYIPCGSTNDFSKSLRFPTEIEEAAAWLLSGRRYQCDVGVFNSRHFLYIAAFGAFTSASYDTPQNMKNFMGHFAYVLRSLALVPSIRPLRVKIEYDGKVIEDDFLYGMVSNTAAVAGMLKLRSFQLDDGKFEVMLIRRPGNVLDLQRILSQLMNLDGEVDSEYVLYFRASALRFISNEEIPWTVDGEYGGVTCDAEISVCKRAVTFCVGEDAPENDEALPALLLNETGVEQKKEE